MKSKKPILLKSLYGNYTIEQPLIELIQTKTIKRLKKIHQNGPIKYSSKTPINFSRYEHSVGVLALLKKYNATVKEQIAGLLHDASHTVFSHVADLLFEHTCTKSSYQDDIHEDFLKKNKIDVILQKYDLNLHEILHKSGHHKVLEQDLPDICADRLDYNLQDALNAHLTTKQEIKKILNNLQFEDEKWFFTNPTVAYQFAKLPLYMTEKLWCGAINLLVYHWTAEALKIATKAKVITYDDIHYSTDDIVWEKLHQSKNKEILSLTHKVRNPHKYFTIGDKQKHDLFLKGKFRGIDPLIKVKNNFIRLTEINSEFKSEYQRVQKTVDKGLYIIERD